MSRWDRWPHIAAMKPAERAAFLRRVAKETAFVTVVMSVLAVGATAMFVRQLLALTPVAIVLWFITALLLVFWAATCVLVWATFHQDWQDEEKRYRRQRAANCVLCGADRSTVEQFFSECFEVTPAFDEVEEKLCDAHLERFIEMLTILAPEAKKA